MCRIQQHGGPDDEGFYINEKSKLVLGHRRLSLIDLSATGHQPMSYANERFYITYNGELYNYLELKEDLLKAGCRFKTGSDTEVMPGKTFTLTILSSGTLIPNIDMDTGRGGQLVRSAGVAAQIVALEGEYALVRLPSGETRRIRSVCMATIGQVSNPDHGNISFGKAGRKRMLGKKPHVRGVAMNPVDHPLGGGEGKASGGRPACSPWGKPEGIRTRHNKRTDMFIVKRRK